MWIAQDLGVEEAVFKSALHNSIRAPERVIRVGQHIQAGQDTVEVFAKARQLHMPRQQRAPGTRALISSHKGP
jgi:hypothetical protein